MIENLVFNEIISNFDFSYMLVVNLLTYGLIKVIDAINKDKVVSTWQKRLVFIVSVVIMFAIYASTGEVNWKTLVNSTILAPVFWSWILRPLVDKLNINYKK